MAMFLSFCITGFSVLPALYAELEYSESPGAGVHPTLLVQKADHYTSASRFIRNLFDTSCPTVPVPVR